MVLEIGLTAFLAGLRTPLIDEFFLSLTSLGSLTFAMTLVAGTYFISKKYSFKLLAGSLAAYLSAHSLKLLFGFPRPPSNTMMVNVSTASFPSGHTAMAFALAVILSDMTPEMRNYFYTIAALVGFSRIYLGAHFLVDILAGAFLGYLIGKAALSERFSEMIRL